MNARLFSGWVVVGLLTLTAGSAAAQDRRDLRVDDGIVPQVNT